MQLSFVPPSLPQTKKQSSPQFGADRPRSNFVSFDVEENHHPTFGGCPSGKKTTFGMIIVGLLVLTGGILGGIGVACNKKPNGTVASLRMNNGIQIPNMCPQAYLKENGDVIHPLLRYKDGHIDENGKASGKLGVRAKGMAKDGKVYENFLGIDGAKLPLPKFKVDEDGDVKDGLTNFPKGNIKTYNQEIPRNQRDALALWG